jgi:hypothetical protein
MSNFKKYLDDIDDVDSTYKTLTQACRIMYEVLALAEQSLYNVYYDDDGKFIEIVGKYGLAKEALTKVDELVKDKQ